MMNRLPAQLPPLSYILDDLAVTSSHQVAKYLDVSERQVRTWCKADQAPRAAHAALFWVSRWGFSVLDCELHNRAELHRAIAVTLRHELVAMRRQFDRVIALGDFGCANAPVMAYATLRSVG